MPDPNPTALEFALQSQPMAKGRSFNAREAVEPFLRLLGSPPATPILDLACGPGIVTAALAAAGAHVVAYDLTQEMLDSARSRIEGPDLPRVEFRKGLAENLPFEPATFGAAVTRLSIHHFEDPHVVAAELRRVVRDGAPLVVGDIVCSKDPAEARLHNALETLRDPSHVRLLDEALREIMRALAEAGLRAGFDLRCEADEVCFTHDWRFVRAVAH
jgi:ubiquinone/menaquinone biosynthesis C-methylase UbiE